MRVHPFALALVVGSLLLAGCAVNTANWTQADWDAYNQIIARGQQSQTAMDAQTQAIMQQNSQYQAPQVMNPAQPNSTAIVYCLDLTGTIVACKRLQ